MLKEEHLGRYSTAELGMRLGIGFGGTEGKKRRSEVSLQTSHQISFWKSFIKSGARGLSEALWPVHSMDPSALCPSPH